MLYQFSEFSDDEDDPRFWLAPNPFGFPPPISPIKDERKPKPDNGFEFTDDIRNQMPAVMPANALPGDPALNHPAVPGLVNHPHLPSHFGPQPQPPFNMKIVKREINNATLIDDEEYAQQRRR